MQALDLTKSLSMKSRGLLLFIILPSVVQSGCPLHFGRDVCIYFCLLFLGASLCFLLSTTAPATNDIRSPSHRGLCSLLCSGGVLIVSLVCMHKRRGFCILRDVGRDDWKDVVLLGVYRHGGRILSASVSTIMARR